MVRDVSLEDIVKTYDWLVRNIGWCDSVPQSMVFLNLESFLFCVKGQYVVFDSGFHNSYLSSSFERIMFSGINQKWITSLWNCRLWRPGRLTNSQSMQLSGALGNRRIMMLPRHLNWVHDKVIAFLVLTRRSVIVLVNRYNLRSIALLIIIFLVQANQRVLQFSSLQRDGDNPLGLCAKTTCFSDNPHSYLSVFIYL